MNKKEQGQKQVIRTPTSDNADDGPMSDESLDTDKGIMERMNETLNKYSEEK